MLYFDSFHDYRGFFIPQIQYLSAHGYDVTVVCSHSKLLQKKLGDGIKYVPIDIPRGIII